MPVILFSLFLLIFTSIIGVNHVDSALTMAKHTWLQDQVDLALYHASIVPHEEGLNEGIKEMQLDEAKQRFFQRLQENADFTFSSTSLLLTPGTNSLTKYPVAVYVQFISLEESQQSWNITMKYTGGSWQEMSRVSMGTGGELNTKVITKEGKTLTLPPKHLHGPSLIALAYADEKAINPNAGESQFPIVSVQSIHK